MKLEADNAVIGAGVVGLAIARAPARDGRDVLVLEKQPLAWGYLPETARSSMPDSTIQKAR